MTQAIAATATRTAGQTDTRDRILVTAERLFRQYGYAKTTVADIAKDMGMSTANIYRFFASKADVHQALCAKILAERERVIEDIANEDAPAADRLARMMAAEHRSTRETLVDERGVHEMVAVAMDQQWGAIQAHLDRIVAAMARVIADGIARGEFREQDPERAARTAKAAAVSLCHPRLLVQFTADPHHATLQELTDFILRALRA